MKRGMSSCRTARCFYGILDARSSCAMRRSCSVERRCGMRFQHRRDGDARTPETCSHSAQCFRGPLVPLLTSARTSPLTDGHLHQAATSHTSSLAAWIPISPLLVLLGWWAAIRPPSRSAHSARASAQPVRACTTQRERRQHPDHRMNLPLIAGYHCPTMTIEPRPCKRGTYCPLGATSEVNCPSGTFGEDEMLQRSDQCRICSAGSTCPTGSTQETPCARGSFSAAERAASCAVCPQGSYQDEKGQSACKICMQGHYVSFLRIQPFVFSAVHD